MQTSINFSYRSGLEFLAKSGTLPANGRNRIPPGSARRARTVSYTHLDVYKRQEHKAQEMKTEEAPAEKGSVPAAESNSPATKGDAAAAEGSAPTTKGNTPAAEENAAVAEGSASAAERNTPVAETPGSAESGTAKTSGCGEAINERFVRFLRRHHVLTLATVAEGVPYCSNCLLYTSSCV